tara:strand:- start:224 stop:823 length:600 start_codon:yes stop_codon:yes gene_type:complete
MLVKHNNNSISELTTAGQLAQGKMTLISSQTASGSASIEFTSGIDSTYPIYRFEFINCHPSTNDAPISFQASTDGGNNYGVTITSSAFRAAHRETDATTFGFTSGEALAQSTSFQPFSNGIGNESDESVSGTLKIFNPSSTTFVKHFLTEVNGYQGGNWSITQRVGGYFNTTLSLDAFQFKFSSGNIDSGTIKLYGIGD